MMSEHKDNTRELNVNKADLSADGLNHKSHSNDLRAPLHDFNRYSIQFDVAVEEEEDKPKMTKEDFIKYGLITLVCLIVIFLIYRLYGREGFEFLLHTLRVLAQSDSIFSYILLVLSHFIFGWILFMPGHSTFNILQAFLMQSFLKPFILSTLGSCLASISIFMIIKTYFRAQIVEKFKSKILFRIVYIEVKKRPVQMGILFNLLFIPTNVKNYLMALTSITLQEYIMAVVPVHTFYCAMFAFVGYSMKDINSLFHDKPFSEKTTAEQFQTVMTYLLLLLTIGLMVAFFFLAKKKYEEIEAEHRKQAQEALQHMKELEKVPPQTV